MIAVGQQTTARIDKVIELAQLEAKELKHGYIGTEHMVLGILRDEKSLGARILAERRIDIESFRARVIRIVGEGFEDRGPGMSFTPRAQEILQIASEEARALGHDQVGSAHLLLGLARENDGVAVRIILDLDTDADTLRRTTLRYLDNSVSGRLDLDLEALTLEDLVRLGQEVLLVLQKCFARKV